MDRASFLRCLPYFHPAPPQWPPPSSRHSEGGNADDVNCDASHDVLNGDHGSCAKDAPEVTHASHSSNAAKVNAAPLPLAIPLLQNHIVSIEPTVSIGGKEACSCNVGPAFFGANVSPDRGVNAESDAGKSSDAAMCSFDAFLLGVRTDDAEAAAMIASASKASPAASSATLSTTISGSQSQSPLHPKLLPRDFGSPSAAAASASKAGQSTLNVSSSAMKSRHIYHGRKRARHLDQNGWVVSEDRNRQKECFAPVCTPTDESLELYFRFDDSHAFLVDFSCIVSLEVDESFGHADKATCVGEEMKTPEGSTKSVPPSLVVAFPHCSFRIFSFQSHTHLAEELRDSLKHDDCSKSSSTASSDGKQSNTRKSLHATRSLLRRVLGRSPCTIPAHVAAWKRDGCTDLDASHADSSDPSSVEAGQREEVMDHHGGRYADDRSDGDSVHENECPEKGEEKARHRADGASIPLEKAGSAADNQSHSTKSHGIACDARSVLDVAVSALPTSAKKHRIAYKGSWSAMQSAVRVAQAAATPTFSSLFSHVSNSCGEGELAEILTSAAVKLGDGYGDEEEVSAEVERCRLESLQLQHDLEDTFSQLFPSRRSKHQRGTSASPAKSSSQDDLEDLRMKAEDLVKQHKVSVASRHLLALMPKR